MCATVISYSLMVSQRWANSRYTLAYFLMQRGRPEDTILSIYLLFVSILGLSRLRHFCAESAQRSTRVSVAALASSIT